MKNINAKKVVAGVAALGLSALLAGSVIAANVGNGDFGMDITKDTLYQNGIPKVNVVVGSDAQPVDVVWAGNIAAAIGKNAYTLGSSSGAGALNSVTVEVGSEGIASVSGDGKLFDDISLNTPITDIELRHIDASFLNNETIDVDKDTNFGGNKFSSSKMTVKDSILINGGTIGFNRDKDIADIVAAFGNETIHYIMNLGTGIPINYRDADSSERMKITFMGKKYIVDQVTDNSIKLLLDKADLSLSKGDTFEPEEGYVIEVSEILHKELNKGYYEVELILKDTSGNVIKTDVFKDDDQVFKNELEAVVKINTVYNARVTIMTGSSARLTLIEGEIIKDFPTKGDEHWNVELDYNGTDYLKKITIFNDVDYEFIDEDALKIGDSIDIFGGLADLTFVGLTSEPTTDVKIEKNNIYFTDRSGNNLNTFLYETRTSQSAIDKYTTKGTVDGHKLYIAFDGSDINAITWDDKDGVSAYVGHNANDYFVVKSYDVKDANYTFKYQLEDSNKQLSIALADINGESIGKSTYVLDIDVNEFKYVDTEGEAYFTIGIKNGSEIDANVYIDVYTGKLIDVDNFDGSHQVKTTNGNLGVKKDDLDWAMTDYGVKYSIKNGGLLAEIPDNALEAMLFIGAGSGVETTLNGGEVVLTTPGEVVKTDDGKISAKLVSASVGGATGTAAILGNWDAGTNRIVYLDTETMSGANSVKIIVGGHLVNNLAKGITDEYLVQDGQFVVGTTSNGNIIVAGYNASDTADAARKLIEAIEEFE